MFSKVLVYRFSYRFFVSSFDKRYLCNYAILFFFHLLSKFQVSSLYMLRIVLKYMLHNIYVMIKYLYFGIRLRCAFVCSYLLFLNILFVFYDILRLSIIPYYLSATIRSLINMFFKFLFCLFGCIRLSYLLYSMNSIVLHVDYAFGMFRHAKIMQLPIKSSIITLLRSPHVDKKARDQYAFLHFRCGMYLSYLPLQLYRTFISGSVGGIGIKVLYIRHLNFD